MQRRRREKQEERGQGAHAVRSTRSPRAAPDASEASVRGAVPTAAEVWHTLARSSAVVGMHPDGATEAIIDFALATGKASQQGQSLPNRRSLSWRTPSKWHAL